MSQKFHVETMGPAPTVDSSNMLRLKPADVMKNSARHIRTHSSSVEVPATGSHLSVLANDPALQKGAFEIAEAHMQALFQSLKNPTASAIQKQTPQFALSLGMEPDNAPRPGLSFPKKSPGKSPTMR